MRTGGNSAFGTDSGADFRHVAKRFRDAAPKLDGNVVVFLHALRVDKRPLDFQGDIGHFDAVGCFF